MMAFGHCTSGLYSALMLINAFRIFYPDRLVPDTAVTVLTSTVVLAILAALAFGGAATSPDIDHKNSTITTAFGPLSYAAHRLIIELHYMVCSLTREAENRKPPGAHRGVTHWWPFPLVSGVVTYAGCYLTPWFMYVILVILFTTALRALTVPDYRARPGSGRRRQWSMRTTHKILNLIPYMRVLKKSRKYINAKNRIGGKLIGVTLATGKVMTVCAAIDLTLIAHHYRAEDYSSWLGVLVALGMYLHILGDYPTESGGPGWRLTRTWRLPKWLAFKAGGPFEIIVMWIPGMGYTLYLIPGLRPYHEVLNVERYALLGLSSAIVLAIIIHLLNPARGKASR